VLRSMGRLPEAEKLTRDNLDLRKKLVDEFPKDPNAPNYRYLLATAHRNLGGLLLDTGQLPQADKALRAALAICKELGDAFPQQSSYREEQSILQTKLCVLLVAWGRLPQAEQACRAALDITRKLAKDFPDRPEFRAGHAHAYHNLGNLLRDT